MKKDKETLVLLLPGFPALETDSNCLPSQQSFVRSLKAIYPQLHIIVLSFQYPYHTKRYDWFDMEVIPFSGKNRGGLPRLLLRRKIYSALREIGQTYKIIGLLSFWLGECALTGKRFGEKYAIPHYCWIRGQDARENNKYPRRLRPAGNQLIALSDFLQNEFEKNHGTRPVHIIPQGIDKRQLAIPAGERDIDILGVGSLIFLKRYDVFIELVAEIKKQVPDIKVVLIGDGLEREKLDCLVVKLDLQSTVQLTGEISHERVLQFMQRTKLLLHPSLYEGFSGVCLEALAAGAHVISFCKAMDRPLEHWYIVDNREAMRQKALEILRDPFTGYYPVMPFLMEDAARAVAGLFGYGTLD